MPGAASQHSTDTPKAYVHQSTPHLSDNAKDTCSVEAHVKKYPSFSGAFPPVPIELQQNFEASSNSSSLTPLSSERNFCSIEIGPVKKTVTGPPASPQPTAGRRSFFSGDIQYRQSSTMSQPPPLSSPPSDTVCPRTTSTLMERDSHNEDAAQDWSHSSVAALKRFFRVGSDSNPPDDQLGTPRIASSPPPTPHVTPESPSATWQSFLRHASGGPWRLRSADFSHSSPAVAPESTDRNAPSRTPLGTHRRLLPKELADQIRKGVTFTANVVGEAVGVNELRGVPDAPRASRLALDLADVALQVRENQTKELGLSSPAASSDDFGVSLTQPRSALPDADASCQTIVSQSPPLWPLKKSYENPPPPRRHKTRTHGSYIKLPAHDILTPSTTNIAVGPSRRCKKAFSAEPETETVSLTRPHLSEQPLSTQLDRLVIMSFNAGLLEYRLAGLTWYRNPPFTKRRLYQMAPALRNADCDLVALQEVYEEWQADYLIGSLRVTFPFVARRTSGGSFSLHNGLMILSRFPILRTAFHPFGSVTAIERIFGSKGMLEATVEIPTVGQVTFVNIHLASGAVDPESTSLEALRNEEIGEVLEVCRIASGRGEIPVIIGDLNAAPNLCPSNYRKLCESGWRDAFLGAIRGNSAAEPEVEVAALDECWKDCRDLRHVPGTYPGDAKLTSTGKVILAKHFIQGGLPFRGFRFGNPSRKRRHFIHHHHRSRRGREDNTLSSNSNVGRDPIHGSSRTVVTGKSPAARGRWVRTESTDDESPGRTDSELQETPTEGADTCTSGGEEEHRLLHRGDTKMTNTSWSPDDESASVIPNYLQNASTHQRAFPPSRNSNGATYCVSFEQENGNCAFSSPDSRITSQKVTLTNARRQRPSWLARHYNMGGPSSSPLRGSRRRHRHTELFTKPHRVTGRMATFVKKASWVLGCDPDEPTYKEMAEEGDPFCTMHFTWDPKNPLNVIGPHSECHGLRCDHVFLPPKEASGGLATFQPTQADVVFTDPQVTVEGCCCGLFGQASLITLSDHYAIRIELQRLV